METIVISLWPVVVVVDQVVVQPVALADIGQQQVFQQHQEQI